MSGAVSTVLKGGNSHFSIQTLLRHLHKQLLGVEPEWMCEHGMSLTVHMEKNNTALRSPSSKIKPQFNPDIRQT